MSTSRYCSDSLLIIGVQDELFFSSMLSAFLHSFDSAGGGAIGYVRRSMFIQCMLFCIIHSSQSSLERLEEVFDCAVNVIAEEEVGEEKLRILLTEKRSIGMESLTSEYVRKYALQSNVRQSCILFMRVEVVKRINK